MSKRPTAPTLFPLAWPEGWPRSEKRHASAFRTTLAGALKNVNDELVRFANDSGRKMTEVTISSNVSLGVQNPTDPGVAIYFTWDALSTCIAVDRYAKVEDNLQAIYHVLDAERTKLRHGGLNLVRAAFRGYAALPPPNRAPKESWWATLQVNSHESTEQVTARYKQLRSLNHPDKGGDPGAFDQIQRAWEQFTQERGL